MSNTFELFNEGYPAEFEEKFLDSCEDTTKGTFVAEGYSLKNRSISGSIS
jgi:hypothetical protein